MSKSALFCPNCNANRDAIVMVKTERLPVRGEEIEVRARVAVCTCCKEDVPDEELDEATLNAAYEEYRRKHDIVSPLEIRELRQRYGLSQRGMAALLGWGKATVSRYETGQLPDRGHNLTLKGLRDPGFVSRLLQENGPVLPSRERERIEEHLKRTSEKLLSERVLDEIVLSSDRRPTLHNGYRILDFARLGLLTVFFARQCNTKLWKTALMKMLFYADFSHFQKYGVSLTGASYARLPNGPAVDKYRYILAVLEDQGYFELRTEPVGAYEGEVVVPLAEFDEAEFNPRELQTIRNVASKLADLTASTLSNLSHHEEGWKELKNGEIIPYSYADSLKV